jgi:hypothetical protein
MVIVGPGSIGAREIEGRHRTWEQRDALMKSLYIPLPITHPRVQAWIAGRFLHHKRCYQVPELRAAGKNWHDAMLIWPGGCLGRTPFGELRDETSEIKYALERQCYAKWTDEAKRDFSRAIADNNARVTEMCQKVAIPDNHGGTIIVREVYPDFQPTAELLEARFERPGDWWEVLTENPGPKHCPGIHGQPHPANGRWCQFCGWTADA